MRVALIGYGHVARSFAGLLHDHRRRFPFLITGVHTLHHGTVYGDPLSGEWQQPAGSIDEFLDRSQPEVLIELSSLNPLTGEPALSHVRAGFARGLHVVTANKGPIAHAWRSLRQEAAARQVQFRFESTVMDGAPVFNMVRNCLPGVAVKGISGALNSTTKLILGAMERGLTFEEGVQEAQRIGVAETNPDYDIDGWDSAVKASALANVLMDADVTPQQVQREGIRGITPADVRSAAAQGMAWVLISRATCQPDGSVILSARPELLPRTDPLANVTGTSNLLLLHTDLMGTVGSISIEPGVSQTAYGVLSDLVDIARSI